MAATLGAAAAAETSGSRTTARRLCQIYHQLHCQRPFDSVQPEAVGQTAAAGPLSATQVQDYVRDGYLLVEGLIPAAMAAEAEAVVWGAMAGAVPTCAGDPYASGGRVVGDKARPSVTRAEAEAGGASGWVGILDHPAILAVVTQAYAKAAEQLATALHQQIGRPAVTVRASCATTARLQSPHTAILMNPAVLIGRTGCSRPRACCRSTRCPLSRGLNGPTRRATLISESAPTAWVVVAATQSVSRASPTCRAQRFMAVAGRWCTRRLTV